VRVIVPHTRLDERTVALLDAHAPGWAGIELDPARPDAYQALLAAEWDRPGDLMLVEHDIGIHAGVVPGFEDCPELWCGHAYPIGEQMLVCLGCTRFRHELKQAVPDLCNRIDSLPFDGSPARDWRRMDVRLAGVLQGLGYAPHTHNPPVEHYHIY
jgi:hypothetical protein